MAVINPGRNEAIVDDRGRPTFRFTKYLENVSLTSNEQVNLVSQTVTEVSGSTQKLLASQGELNARIEDLESVLSTKVAAALAYIEELEKRIADLEGVV